METRLIGGEGRRLAVIDPARRALTKVALIVLALTVTWMGSACSAAPSPSSEGTTVPHLNELVNAASAGSTEDIIELIQFSSLPCTTQEGMGGPPKCLPGEAEGTAVDVLPILGPEGYHMRRSDLDNWTGIADAKLYAAYRTPDDAFADEFFPAGEYGVAFLMPDGANVVIFQVTGDGIVRVDYDMLASFESKLEESEVIIGPESAPE